MDISFAVQYAALGTTQDIGTRFKIVIMQTSSAITDAPGGLVKLEALHLCKAQCCQMEGCQWHK